MDINEQTFRRVEKAFGASLVKANEENFSKLMTSQSLEDCQRVIAWMKVERDFYKKVLEEEYRKKNPNSVRYRDATKFVDGFNAKGKLLKSIIEQKQKQS